MTDKLTPEKIAKIRELAEALRKMRADGDRTYGELVPVIDAFETEADDETVLAILDERDELLAKLAESDKYGRELLRRAAEKRERAEAAEAELAKLKAKRFPSGSVCPHVFCNDCGRAALLAYDFAEPPKENP